MLQIFQMFKYNFEKMQIMTEDIGITEIVNTVFPILIPKNIKANVT